MTSAATAGREALRAIFLAKWRMAHHTVASVRHESKLKVGVLSVSAFLLWVGAFVLFYAGFRWLTRFRYDPNSNMQSIGDIIMVRMLSVFSLSIFLMLIFSNVLVSFSTLYRSKEVNYLLQAPMSFGEFFIARFVECIVFSSWALAFLGTPLLLAYGLVRHAPPAFYIASVAFYLPFVIPPAAIGAIITITLTRIFPRIHPRTLILLGVLAVAALFYYIHNILNAQKLSDDNFLPFVLDATVRTQSPFLPSYWAARGVLAAATRDYRECIFQFLLLSSNALLLFWLATEYAHRMYYMGWSAIAGQDRQRIRRMGRGILGRLEWLLSGLRNPERTLSIKDIRLFWRDPTQWSQFIIFFGIMAIYIANLRNMSRQYEQEFWRSWIACLNIGACSLILSTLTSRFVFPLISLEGRRFWILGLAPITMRQLVMQKFAMSVITTSVFTVGLVVLSGRMLRLEPIYFWLSVYSIVITNFGLAGLAVGLGSLYPNFQEDNPSRIVSGMGGTLNFLLSVGYIAWIVGAQTLILQWRLMGLFTHPGAFHIALVCAVLFVTVLSALCTIVPMRLGLRNLQNHEF